MIKVSTCSIHSKIHFYKFKQFKNLILGHILKQRYEEKTMSISHAIFAAGCFWGIQAVFDNVPGVVSTTVGYTGGTVENPSYQEVCTGSTGHAEAVEVTFDNAKITYDDLLDIYFKSHNPTTLNRQGPDIGTQYRSAVFYLNEEQKQTAHKKIQELTQQKIFPQPIVTQVLPATDFYPAEDYHQKYLAKRGQVSCPSQLMSEKPLGEKTSKPLKTDTASQSDSTASLSNSIPSEEELKQKLNPLQYDVLRRKGTERPFSGKYVNFKEDGTFTCAACGNPIFRSQDKFDSGSGWPSFDQAIPGSIKKTADNSHGMNRTEVTCGRCGSHLGHVFPDGPTSTGNRYCINSVSIDFQSRK